MDARRLRDQSDVDDILCDECGDLVEDCECDLDYARDLFDADELGLDPEEDDSRY